MLIFVSVCFNLFGLLLTSGFSIQSSKFSIDGGSFSDPDSAKIEIHLGIKHKVGLGLLISGITMQIIDALNRFNIFM